ncbi:MAG TPA: maleylpyruvate isomerase family mycothiol-dependent enzyme [Actinomycetota bacterium]|nr:maleylpyruvate isomerase family mycothiol-dependent enzyme [Actinomycetota bacterium]
MSKDQAVVDALEQVWDSIHELCSSLTEQEWKTPTDLPAWSVQDNVAHLTDIELTLQGKPRPDHKPADISHTKSDFGASNEIGVDYRRSWPGTKVLEEFRDLTRQRVEQLRSFGDAEWEAESFTPVGPGTARDMLPFRVLDSWMHEQDIRRALGRPGHLEGPAPELVFGTLRAALPFVVAKRAGVPDGFPVVLDVAGPVGQRVGVIVDGGRGRETTNGEDPAVLMKMDLETLNVLMGGRRDADRVLREGRVVMKGDDALGRKILENLNVVP